MNIYKFSAYDICDEIDLNMISKHFNLNKKFKWEETLILKENRLNGIVSNTEDKLILLYHFGSVVFVNFEHHEAMDAVKYLSGINAKCLKGIGKYSYTEDFILEVKEGHDLEINFNSMITGTINDSYMATLALVLAKSISLDKIEKDVEVLFDEVEDFMDYLDKGVFKMKDKTLSKMSSKILRAKYDIVSYLMLLDKPAIAWENEYAEEIYTQLSELFELSERFEKIKNKTEVLLDVVEVFSSLMHSKRGTILEWIVIILIAFELILPVLEKILH